MDTITRTPAQILETLTGVYDPELGLDVVALGLIYGVEVDGRTIRVRMTLTTPGCPLHAVMVDAVRRAVGAEHPGHSAQVDLVWTPAWTPHRLSAAARHTLGWTADSEQEIAP